MYVLLAWIWREIFLILKDIYFKRTKERFNIKKNIKILYKKKRR